MSEREDDGAEVYRRQIEGGAMAGYRPGTYDASQVRRMTGATDRQLRYWRETKLAVPSIQFSKGRAGVPNLYSLDDVDRVRLVMALVQEVKSVQKARAILRVYDRGHSLPEKDEERLHAAIAVVQGESRRLAVAGGGAR